MFLYNFFKLSEVKCYMIDNIEEIKKYRELLAQHNSAADEALELIKNGKHKEGYDKIIEVMNSCDFSHPKGWADMAVLTVRQAAANADIAALKPAEKGFKKAIDFHAHIFEGDDGLFGLGKVISDNIHKYSDIYRLKIKAETSDTIMKLLDEINQRGTTVLVVTHNMEIVRAMNKRVITIKKGVVVSDVGGDDYED